MAEDEAQFRKLSKDLAVGSLPGDVERAEEKLHGRFGNYVDLIKDLPKDMDLELDADVQAEPDHPKPHLEGGPRKISVAFIAHQNTGRHVLLELHHWVLCKKVPCLA